METDHRTEKEIGQERTLNFVAFWISKEDPLVLAVSITLLSHPSLSPGAGLGFQLWAQELSPVHDPREELLDPTPDSLRCLLTISYLTSYPINQISSH